MYIKIIQELNNFLSSIKIPHTPLNPDAFQGVMVKKLSNQNIPKDKRRIKNGSAASTVKQTHIDITGNSGMLFFFEELNDYTTSIQNIDIDLFYNNLQYLKDIDKPTAVLDNKGDTIWERQPFHSTQLTHYDLIHRSTAYKKYGHRGNQVQINLPDAEEKFAQLQRTAFYDDALVMLRYNYSHYLAILIPREFCYGLYSITNTYGNQNVNYVSINNNYNYSTAREIQRNIIIQDVNFDEISATTFQHNLQANLVAGTDIKRLVKTRISQGAFRRLLLLDQHQCALCNISNTNVLRASHIKEWAESTREERIDANNGLLLCANHDALFDRHLISFDPNTGQICISPSISEEQQKELNISKDFVLHMSSKTQAYMHIHYEKFKEKNL